MDPWLLWLIAAGLFAAGEIVSLDLVLLMFAGGALGGMAVALLGGAHGAPAASPSSSSPALLLAVVRPVAKQAPAPSARRCSSTASTPSSGAPRKVTRRDRLSPAAASGWAPTSGRARTQHSGETFAIGDTVRILEVDGATAVVGDALE